MVNGTICELTNIHRFDGSKLLQDAHKCANGENIEFNDYTNEEHDLALCWTNQAVDAINQKWNKHYAIMSSNWKLTASSNPSMFCTSV